MHSLPLWPRRGLYAITPDEPDTGRLVRQVDAVLAAGAACLQYRHKGADGALRHAQALALREVCRAHAVPLIVNDDVDLALEVEAQGVHLGGDDGDIADARRRLGAGAIIGASCYDQAERAVAAVEQGASYVAFGAFFPSSTKPLARRASLPLLIESAGLGVPRVAIGGITPDNAAVLVAAGADLLAVINGVFGAADPAAAARLYIESFSEFPA